MQPSSNTSTFIPSSSGYNSPAWLAAIDSVDVPVGFNAAQEKPAVRRILSELAAIGSTSPLYIYGVLNLLRARVLLRLKVGLSTYDVEHDFSFVAHALLSSSPSASREYLALDVLPEDQLNPVLDFAAHILRLMVSGEQGERQQSGSEGC